jgi:hypothetical protein
MSGETKPMHSVAVYCGSNPGARPLYREAAETLGRMIAAQGRTLVYGGAKVGLMGALAQAALADGGRVVGVLPRSLEERELAQQGLAEMHLVDTMHERKAKMAALSDGFIALPGGLGTLEELFEAFTWQQLKIHAKPCGLLNAGGYYSPLRALMDHAVAEGFIKADHRDALIVAEEPQALLDAMDRFEPPTDVKWFVDA